MSLQQVRRLCLPAGILPFVCIAAGWHYSVELLDCVSPTMDMEGSGYSWGDCGQLYLVAEP